MEGQASEHLEDNLELLQAKQRLMEAQSDFDH